MSKTPHHFFLSPGTIRDHSVTITDRAQVHQIGRVLRMKKGQEIVVLDNKGSEYHVQIESFSKHEISGKILSKQLSQAEPSLRIRLFQALTKPLSKFEEVLRHGTEIGVSEFYPLITQNCEIRTLKKNKYTQINSLFSEQREREGEAPFQPQSGWNGGGDASPYKKDLNKRPRMKTILKEAAEQSHRGKIPVLGPEVSFEAILKTGWPSELVADISILAHTDKTHLPLRDILKKIEPSTRTLNLFIGPEGGFTQDEINRACDRDIEIFTLGPRILRTETAGVAIVSALLFALELQ